MRWLVLIFIFVGYISTVRADSVAEEMGISIFSGLGKKNIIEDIPALRDTLKKQFEGKEFEELKNYLKGNLRHSPFKLFLLTYDDFFSFEVFVPTEDNIVKFRCGGNLNEEMMILELWFSRGYIYSTLSFSEILSNSSHDYVEIKN